LDNSINDDSDIMAKQQKADGDAGGRRAAAQLSVALCAETAHATLREDWAKVDLKLGFRNWFAPASLVTIHCQVKSGNSFCAAATNKKTITLQNIDAATIDSLQAGTQPALIVWVPPGHARPVYWNLVKPRGSKNLPIKISRFNYVRPSLQVDLSRHHVFLSSRKSFPRITLPKKDADTARREAKTIYQELKKSPLTVPLCGSVVVSRLGWRHVTRRSRASLKRDRSFRLVPYIRVILGHHPTRYLVTTPDIMRRGSEVIERREIIQWYEDAVFDNGKLCDVLTRIVEEISYPADWQSQPIGVADIKCKRTLKSWWFKEKQKNGQ
jgi:hypothetical protein